MKFIKMSFLFSVCLLLLCSCQSKTASLSQAVREIRLSDEVITLDGAKAAKSKFCDVYTANDIVYYEAGKDFTYGEGGEKDAHDKKEADAHTVLHIASPGVYRLKGKLSHGQIAVDLGKDAKEDPDAVVTLILDGVDITCTVAPAVIFYNVYECASTDTQKAEKDVDTSKAGANVILADGSKNTINGSYVEKIYKPDSVVLNDDETQVEDAKKLHKYDGAFYSKMSLNVSGEKKGTGELVINAENEGLDSELHLTINGGNINIFSGNDGINTNEDKVSVTTVNGGKLNIKVTGETGEGDGIDSNGWLVINGGSVFSQAYSNSADSGLDSDMGIHINGGVVIASGNMLDRIENSDQTHAVFRFQQKQTGASSIKLKNKSNQTVLEANLENDCTILLLSSPELVPDTYTLWSGDKQLEGQSGFGGGGGFGGGFENKPNDRNSPTPPNGNPPDNFDPNRKENRPGSPDFKGDKFRPGSTPPQGGATPPEMPDGKAPEMPEFDQNSQDFQSDFEIKKGANSFGNVRIVTEKTNTNSIKA